MKSFQIQILLFGIAVLLFSSCNSTTYTSKLAVSPDLKDKGDIALSGTANGTLELAYSPIRNVGLFARGTRQSGDYKNEVGTYEGKTYGSGFLTWTETIPIYQTRKVVTKDYEMGIGFYHTFNDIIRIQTYFSGGKGSFKDYAYQHNPFTGNTRRIGIHPSFIYIDKRWEFGIHMSFLNLKYDNLENDFLYWYESQSDYMTENNSRNFKEVYCSLKVNFNRVSLFAQLGVTGDRNLPEVSVPVNNTVLTLGGTVHLYKLRNKETL